MYFSNSWRAKWPGTTATCENVHCTRGNGSRFDGNTNCTQSCQVGGSQTNWHSNYGTLWSQLCTIICASVIKTVIELLEIKSFFLGALSIWGAKLLTFKLTFGWEHVLALAPITTKYCSKNESLLQSCFECSYSKKSFDSVFSFLRLMFFRPFSSFSSHCF